jgi:hypothetical protein
MVFFPMTFRILVCCIKYTCIKCTCYTKGRRIDTIRGLDREEHEQGHKIILGSSSFAAEEPQQ